MGDTIEPAPCSPRFFSSVQKVFVYTGGVEVAGSNPVSPTSVFTVLNEFWSVVELLCFVHRNW